MAKNVVDGIVVKGQTYTFVATDDNLATIETDATKASKAYAVGDHLILDGQYYVVTAAIAKNGSITVGTNIEAQTVGEEVANLNTKTTDKVKYNGSTVNTINFELSGNTLTITTS